MTEFEKETKRRVYIFIKISTFNSAKCETTARAHDAFCHLHRHDVLTVPLTVLIYTLSNYKHDAYTVLLVLKLISLCTATMHASLISEKHSSTVKKDCLSFYLLSNCFYILSLKIEENIFLQVKFLSVRIYKPEKFFSPKTT